MVGKALQDVVQKQKMGRTEDFEWRFLSTNDGNLVDPQVVNSIFERFQPTVVVHLAANVGGLFKNMNMRLRMYEDNLLMNTYVLQACAKYRVTKIISMLSTCIFPDKVEPLTVEKLHQGPPHPSNEGYAYAKRMIDVHTRVINHTLNTTCINLIPTNIYGKYDNFNLEDGHVLPSLVHKCYLAKTHNTPFTVCGTGSPLRQFIYNMDLANIIYKFICGPITGHHTVMCSPPASHELSIKDLTSKIVACMEFTGEVRWDSTYPDGQYKKTVEPSAILEDLGISWTPIEAGLQETIRWFEDAYPNMRL